MAPPSRSAQARRMHRRLKNLPKAVVAAATPALREAAEEIAADMRRKAPEKTGALKKSIAVTGPGEMTPDHSQPGGSAKVPEDTVAITAGNDEVRYAHLVEYGTDAAKAQPFFWPACRTGKKRAKAKIGKAIRKALREGSKT